MLALLKEELGRRRAEHLVCAAAVAVITAAVVAQHSFARAAESAFHDLAHRLGANMLVLPGALDPGAFYRQEYGSAALPADAEQRLRSSGAAQHLRSIVPRLFGHFGSGAGRALVVGDAGSWPAADGDTQPSALGTVAARRLGVEEGGVLALGDERFHVLGVAAAPLSGLDEAVFVPLPVAQRLLGSPGRINALELGGCWCRIDIASLAKQVEEILPGTRAITVAGMEAAQKGSVATVERSAKVSLAAGSAFVAAAIAALTAAQVRRRRREIGLLLAVGASSRQIRVLFATQAALAASLGAAAGWVLAWPLTRVLSREFLGMALSPSLETLPLALAAGACVAALAAYVPARLAASLDPTEVLQEA